MSKPVRVIYNSSDSKIIFFMPFCKFHKEIVAYIENYLFEVQKVTKSSLRLFWIEGYNTEVEIATDFDVEIFHAHNGNQLYVSPKKDKTNPGNLPGPSVDDATNFIVHDRVECDGCNASPIVGFRYKCIECPNFDLCQRCEAQHKHPQHMLLRMPNPNCPSFLEAHITPPGVPFAFAAPKVPACRRRESSKKSSRPSSCPFMAADNGKSTPTDGYKNERTHLNHHERKQQRRMRLFTNFYDMMQDLAEGGAAAAATGTTANAATSTECKNAEPIKPATAEEILTKINGPNLAATCTFKPPTAQETAAIAAQAAQVAAENAAKVAAETAAKFAPLLANSCPFKATTTTPFNAENKEATTTKTPPSTPDSTATTQSQATRTPNSPYSPFGASLEQISQYIDPQVMKTGIDILNNFSEMFAKMIDPTDDVASSNEEETQQSTNSEAAAVSTAASNAAPNAAFTAAPNAAFTAAPNAAFTAAPTAPSRDSSVESSNDSSAQSEDGDWQVIASDERRESMNSANGAVGGSITSIPAAATPISINSVGAEAVNASINMNYEQLSKDLKAHVEEEKRKEEQSIKLNGEVDTNTAEASTSTTTDAPQAPVATPRRPEDKRAIPVYHKDKFINEAILAMMAMGFSNEGAYLTQLLDSVKGDIPKALDIIQSSQYNRQ